MPAVRTISNRKRFREKDVHNERRSHFNAGGATLSAGGFFIVPWMYNAGVHRILELHFSPIRADVLRIKKSMPAPYPDGVPATDAALTLKGAGGTSLVTLWYDPCTFTLDAYGSRENLVRVRTALVSEPIMR